MLTSGVVDKRNAESNQGGRRENGEHDTRPLRQAGSMRERDVAEGAWRELDFQHAEAISTHSEDAPAGHGRHERGKGKAGRGESDRTSSGLKPPALRPDGRWQR